MAKIPDITLHAKKTGRRGEWSYEHGYECLHCGKQYTAYYDDQKNIRAHLRKYHRLEYYRSVPFTIEEEPDEPDYLLSLT